MNRLNKIISVLLVVCMMLPMLPELGITLDAATAEDVVVSFNPNGGTINGNTTTFSQASVSVGDARTWKTLIKDANESPTWSPRAFLYYECTTCGYHVDYDDLVQETHWSNKCSAYRNPTLKAVYTGTSYYTVTFKRSSGTFVEIGDSKYCKQGGKKENRIYYIDVGVKVKDAIPYDELKITYESNDVFSGWVMYTGNNTTVNWYNEALQVPYDIYHTNIRNHSSAGSYYFGAKFINREAYMTFNSTVGNFNYTPSKPNNIEYGIKVDSKNIKYPVAIDQSVKTPTGDYVTAGDQGVEYYNTLFYDFEPGTIPTPTASGFTFLGFWYGNKASNIFYLTPTTAYAGYPWWPYGNTNDNNQGTKFTELYSVSKVTNGATNNETNREIAVDGSVEAYWRCNNSGPTTQVAYTAPTCTTNGSRTLRCTNCYNNRANSAYIENYHSDKVETIPAGHTFGVLQRRRTTSLLPVLLTVLMIW